jgi:adenylate kinase family enzyme
MKNFIAYINGPSGIGKTTAAVAIAQKYEKGVSIDIDIIKHFIKTGVLGEHLSNIDELASTKKDGEYAWYYRMLAHTTCDVAERFYDNGYVVTISDMMWENWILDIYRQRLSHTNYAHFLLEMPKELLEKRLVERTRQERILQKIASEKIDDQVTAQAFIKNSIVITDEQLQQRIKIFTDAMSQIDKSKVITMDIDSMTVDQIVEKIIGHYETGLIV